MAAAEATMVCFVKVDPSFQVVLHAMSELQANKRMRPVCTVMVGNTGLRSASNNGEFGGLNGFSRTLGSVLRAFMLRSTHLEGLHDPRFSESREFNLDLNLAADAVPSGYARDASPSNVPPDHLQLVHDVAQAQEISANFDRLYPHFTIENRLAAVPLQTWVDFRQGMMAIVEVQSGVIVRLHTIHATVRARHMGPAPMQEGHRGPNRRRLFECPNPNVVRTTSEVRGLQPGQSAGMFPKFNRLMEIIYEHLDIMEGHQDDDIVGLLANLSIDEEVQDSSDEDDQASEEEQDDGDH
ncbi:Hypp4341 [Branchiostoma lanceolatum]|uniref:Hypp4341 protein n=1 Tax=Branchiostoma lanceolatum TaxID=7740 RepID=A0A8K0ACW8_BRALA|nr:Hypp4341 [Branchiostoma lanceolatum]